MSETNCENCTYYTRHYYRLGFSYKEVNCGHCKHRKTIINLKTRDNICEHYLKKDTTIKKQQAEKGILSYIDEIHKKLNDIADYLNQL